MFKKSSTNLVKETKFVMSVLSIYGEYHAARR